MTKQSTSTKKKGLKAFDHHIFQLGDDAQTDILMRLNF
jgi:hypothetical protein